MHIVDDDASSRPFERPSAAVCARCGLAACPTWYGIRAQCSGLASSGCTSWTQVRLCGSVPLLSNVRDDRGQRPVAVMVDKAGVAGKGRRCEPHNAADSRKNLGHESIPVSDASDVQRRREMSFPGLFSSTPEYRSLDFHSVSPALRAGRMDRPGRPQDDNDIVEQYCNPSKELS